MPAAAPAAPLRRLRAPDRIVVACIVGLLGLPLACVLLAAREPLTPAATAIAATAPGALRLRDLPAMSTPLPVGAAAIRRAVVGAVRRVLGPRGRALLNGVAGPARVDALLPAHPTPAQVARLTDLGALLTLAAADTPGAPQFPNAGRVAFAVLSRARVGGACTAQLDLAFLVAGALPPAFPPGVAAEGKLRAAAAACPGDATPLWLLGQWQSLGYAQPDRALSTFALLERRFPGSAAGWSGAGDALLRMAYVEQAEHAPFTARAHFARALGLYLHALALDPDPGIASAVARARDGLGQHRAAAAALAGVAAPTLRVRVVEYLERAGRFGDAAAEARRLASVRIDYGPALIVDSLDPPSAWTAEDAAAPLSLGAGRLRPATFTILPVVTGGSGGSVGSSGGATASVSDLGFIPRFRQIDGVTGSDRWCPAWAAARDLILDGRPRAALAGIAAGLRGIGPEAGVCADADGNPVSTVLARVARAEADGTPTLFDIRQNMWRFAGRYDRALAVIAAWQATGPPDPRAFDRGGEVAFLTGDFARAAAQFTEAARLIRERTPGWSADEATELVKRGAALAKAGRRADALSSFAEADDVASHAFARGAPQPTDPGLSTRLVIYFARAQAGDVLLGEHRFADALDDYRSAREQAVAAGPSTERIEALDDDAAIAEAYVGQPAPALADVSRALAVDRGNPLFLQTDALALAQLGRSTDAARAYQDAVTSDPTLFPAWNDLGVTLGREHRDAHAVAALRRAVGVRRDYALAWFNLAVVLGRGGPRDALAAQGALARAERLDPALRGRRRQLVADDKLYATNLDLSKPLPPKWSFAASQQQAPLPAVGFTLFLLLGLQAARVAGARGLAGGAQRWLDAARDLLRRLPPALAGFAPSLVAVLATVAVLGWPTAHEGLPGLGLLGLGLLGLVGLVMRVRVVAACRAGVTLRQRAWSPAILVGLAGAVVGVPWAPLPVAEADPPEPRVHRAGPLAAAGVGLAMLVLNAWLAVPVTHALGIAAIVMAASMLTPVDPLDGAKITTGAGTLGGLALAGTALLVALGLQ